MKKIACITTFNQDYYDQMAKTMVETYLEFWPKDVPLYCYTEEMSLDLHASNLHEIDVYEACNPNLQEYLDYIGSHFSRGFAYKAFAWIHACQTLDVDEVIYLDADSITYRPITHEWLESILNEDQLLAYMGVTMNKGRHTGHEHADTGIYWMNLKHDFCKQFINRYENIYLTKEVNTDKDRFPKPNDAYVFADCVLDAVDNNCKVVDFHPERKAHSPIKETILGKYFRHFKGARKKDPNMEKYIDKMKSGAERKDLDKQEKKNKKHAELKKLDNTFRTWKK